MIGTPYCGLPPVPGGASWNLDPLLLTVLALAGLALAWMGRGQRRAGAISVAGWLVLCGALVSPLCNIAVALFGARVAQHLLITLVAAPLVAPALARWRAMRTAGCVLPAVVFALLLWLWHLPLPYAATFEPDAIAWWWMHGTLAASSLWLWAAIFARLEDRPESAALAGLVTAVQMGVLGALLTFAPRPLYSPHAPEATLPWGLTPLEDQQLGGLLMWVPGGLLFAAVMVAALAFVLRPRRAALQCGG
jgi:putative membrane protein